jgi:hypothetical protein
MKGNIFEDVTHLVWVESEGFWQCYITLKITGFLDFLHRPEF